MSEKSYTVEPVPGRSGNPPMFGISHANYSGLGTVWLTESGILFFKPWQNEEGYRLDWEEFAALMLERGTSTAADRRRPGEVRPPSLPTPAAGGLLLDEVPVPRPRDEEPDLILGDAKQ